MDYQRRYAGKGLSLLFLNDPTEKVSSFFKWDEVSESFSAVKGYLVYYEKNEGMHEYMLENKLKTVVREDTASKEPTTDEKLTRTVRSAEGNKNKVRTSEQKRLSNLLGSVSFVMLLVCFVMGAGLIRSDERINVLEHELSLLQSDLEGVQSVFASQSGEVSTETSTQTTSLETTTAVQTTQESKQEEYISYTVEEGDTLLKICKNEYGNSDMLEEVMELNDIEDPSRLYVGMELKLPQE